MALAIVLGVSLFTLGWRVCLVVAAAVPLTLATVLVIMLMTGRELDRITLGALIISVGLLVDDAIISASPLLDLVRRQAPNRQTSPSRCPCTEDRAGRLESLA